jgi:hypothetical protein
MIVGKEKLGINYWSKHCKDISLTPYERKKIWEYLVYECEMLPENKIDFDSKDVKIIIDFSRFIN